MMIILHPRAFELGSMTHTRLTESKEREEVFRHWPSCFTAMQVINNRTCPIHVDTGAPYPSLDLIATLGEFKGGHMHIANCPYDFQQPPGSIFAFSAHMLQHQIESYEGNRISFAWFMKDAVFQYAKVEQIPWAAYDDLVYELQ